MNDEQRAKLKAIARRAALPVALLTAFTLGGILFSGGGGPTDDEHAGHEAAEPSVEVWTCSMHPQIRAAESGQCPICGMDLIPVTNQVDAEDRSANRISLSEGARIRARIRTTPVKRLRSGGVERRLLGRVDYDETRLRTVTSWIGGRIDRLRVRTTGERVGRGQVIATLYSPEVFGAHQDLLVARQQLVRLKGATDSARFGAEAALQASRDRLRLLGVPAGEISTMEKATRPSEQIRIRSPFAGTVIERLATEGSYVKTGSGLFQIADLSRLWVQLDAYESDLPLLEIGQKVSLKVEALPAEAYEGRVTFVDPVLNQRTRTTRVRIEVRNPKGQLRPGMFAEAVVRGDVDKVEESALVIPETAPLFTGRRSIVYVEVPETDSPTYEVRVVRLGSKMGDIYPVISGLSEGEQVVIHGAFTLDADLQIRGGASMMSAPDDNEDGPYDKIVETPDAQKKPLGKVIAHYLALQEALASDNLDGARKASASLAKAAAAIEPKGPAAFRDAWMPLRRLLLEHTTDASHAKTLDDLRTPFRDLSQQIATLLRVLGNPTDESLRLASCPMALAGAGAEWVQRSSEIENPYFGASMHSCGEVHTVVEHGTYLPLEQHEGQVSKPAPAPGGHKH